jgi:sulfur carrier protein
MRIKVKLMRENQERILEFPEKATVKDVVKKLGYNLPGCVVLRNGIPVVEDERVKDNGELVVFLVASGG